MKFPLCQLCFYSRTVRKLQRLLVPTQRLLSKPLLLMLKLTQ
ncbi:hypothetical protein AWRI1631_120880 [Saccharomyces cerevisiae AWRI1631]|uniref:Uncharacterized protein n=1 Tax=Saccharomyces cerevisiae (strain AWRI1631) TaxID=545124 RepID=B5VMX6_YEAS6|nr:hypothetical protein AWRI1631_120880 [Saccharomyces cerevisiae AWRI1631]